MTEASSTPAGPTSQRPGSIVSADVEVVERGFDGAGQRLGGGRGLVAIGNAEAAAAIDGFHAVAGGAQGADEVGDAGEGGAVRREVRIWLPMWMARPIGSIPGRRGGLGIERGGVGPGDAEFVAGAAGGDLVVGAGVDVRVDPRRDASGRGPCARRWRRVGGVPRRFRR